MSMADVIVLMDKGKILQEASSGEIYNDPNSVFIAQFIGSPAMNILEMKDGMKLGFRPEKALMSRASVDGGFMRSGRISTREMLGSETIYKVVMEPFSTMIKSLGDSYAVGDDVIVRVAPEHLYFFREDGLRIRSSDGAAYERARGMAEGLNDVKA